MASICSLIEKECNTSKRKHFLEYLDNIA
jgi:hypothetical protein